MPINTDLSDTPDTRIARWRFGRCLLTATSLELRVDDELVDIEPKPLSLLIYLLRHPGEVVTKDELQEQVWPGRILSESVLSKAMARLRSAIGDNEQTVIRTVHGIGYRLDVPVTIETVRVDPAPVATDLEVGQPLPQRPDWVLRERLKHGGRSEVWLARHQRTRERHVFKFATDAAGITGLKREITLFRLLRQVHDDHPGFLRLIDWNLGEPPYFIESEYVGGGALPEWVEGRGGFATVPMALRLELLAQIAETLAAAHSAGVLHKDLKPGNVFVDADDKDRPTIKLGDFGSGRVLDADLLREFEITRMGFTRTQFDAASGGTPYYLAPELLAGQQPTVQSDLYAFGVLAYQMIVGDFTRPLAPGWEQEVGDELLREDILAAAATRPENRLADAGELARRLRSLDARHAERDRLREAQEAGLRALEVEKRLRSEQERSRLRRNGMSAVAVVLVLGLAASLWQARRATTAADAANAAAERANAQARRAGVMSQFMIDVLDSNAVNTLTDRAPGSMTAKEIAQMLVDRSATQLADQPEDQIMLLEHTYRLFGGWGDKAKSVELMQRLIDVVGKTHGLGSTQYADVLVEIAEIRYEIGDVAEAQALTDQARAVIDANNLRGTPAEGQLLRVHGRMAMPIIGYSTVPLEDFSRVVEIDQKGQTYSTRIGWNLYGKCIGFSFAERVEEARDCYTSAVTNERKLPKPGPGVRLADARTDTVIIASLAGIGRSEFDLGNGEAADAAFTEAMDMWRALRPRPEDEYYDNAIIRTLILDSAGKRDAAIALLREQIAFGNGKASPSAAEMMQVVLARLLIEDGKLAEAGAIIERIRAGKKPGEPPLAYTDAEFHLTRGDLLDRLGRAGDAAPEFKAAVVGFDALGHPEGWQALDARVRWARFNLEHGDKAVAEAEFNKVLQLASGQRPKPALAWARMGLARLTGLRGDQATAVKLGDQAQSDLASVKQLHSPAIEAELQRAGAALQAGKS